MIYDLLLLLLLFIFFLKKKNKARNSYQQVNIIINCIIILDRVLFKRSLSKIGKPYPILFCSKFECIETMLVLLDPI
jgi:hypothetical protein